VKAAAKGIAQSHRPRADGLASADSGAGGTLTLLHHPTGANETSGATGSLSRSRAAVEWLYHQLVGVPGVAV